MTWFHEHLMNEHVASLRPVTLAEIVDTPDRLPTNARIDQTDRTHLA